MTARINRRLPTARAVNTTVRDSANVYIHTLQSLRLDAAIGKATDHPVEPREPIYGLTATCALRFVCSGCTLVIFWL
jgi:hypothetical protein